MGSSGNGMFGTYRGGGAGSIVRGGNNGGDECPLAIENILLEDVAISEYFQSSTQEVIGNLPVSYNYLNLCIKKGKRYSGEIKSSGLSPVPFIVVNLYA